MENKCLIRKCGASGYNYLFTTDRLFCDECLRLLNFDMFTVSELRNSGYEAIVFFNYNDGLHCKDDLSWRTWAEISLALHPQINTTSRVSSPKTFQSIRRSIRNVASGNQENSNEQREEIVPDTVEERENYLRNEYKRQNILNQISVINELLKNTKKKIAIVADMDLIGMDYGDSSDHFDSAIDSWRENHLNENLFIWCYRNGCSQDAHKEYFDQEKYVGKRLEKLTEIRYMCKSNSENGEKPERIVEIFSPGIGEIKNYLNHLRLTKHYAFNYSNIEEMSKTLYLIMKINGWNLSDLHIEMKKIPSKELTVDSLSKFFGYKKDLSGEQQLSKLIGMNNIKKIIDDVKKRYSNKLPKGIKYCSRLSYNEETEGFKKSRLHFALRGNPGTGKTTVAKILGRTLYEIGVLSSGHVEGFSGTTLSDQYVGNSGAKMTEHVKKALGGVLFIDEIGAFSKMHPTVIAEVNGILLDAMTSYSDLCVIIAGYPNELNDYLNSDPGLTRRFGGHIIDLADYTSDELVAILESMAKRDGYSVDSELKNNLGMLFTRMYQSLDHNGRKNWGNAGMAETLLQELVLQADIEESKILTTDYLPETLNYGQVQFRLSEYLSSTKRASNTILVPKVADLIKLSNGVGTNKTLQAEAVISIVTSKGQGSGFIITSDGYAITCNHVIDQTTSILARVRMNLVSGGFIDQYYHCSVVKTVPDADIALIKLLAPTEQTNRQMKFPYLKLMKEPVFERYEKNIFSEKFNIMGFPGGEQSNDNVSLFIGRASSQKRRGQCYCYWLDITGISGNSGSPMICERTGEVVGVFCGSDLFHSEAITEELNYMSPVNFVWNMMDKGEENE